MRIDLLECDDWQKLYLNRKPVMENHRLRVQDVLQWIADEFIDVTEFHHKRVETNEHGEGQFPKELKYD